MLFKNTVLVAVLSFLVCQVAGHARVISPTPRVIGAANGAACGAAVSKKLKSDLAGPVENSVNVIDSDYDPEACDLYFCKGYQYEDNVQNTRVYAPGSVVNMKIDMVARHTGHANVSVVDLAAKVPIARLITWPVYFDNTLGPPNWPKNETDFNVTIPDVGSACANPGDCAIQWWYADSNGQTYMSCVDFSTE